PSCCSASAPACFSCSSNAFNGCNQNRRTVNRHKNPVPSRNHAVGQASRLSQTSRPPAGSLHWFRKQSLQTRNKFLEDGDRRDAGPTPRIMSAPLRSEGGNWVINGVILRWTTISVRLTVNL